MGQAFLDGLVGWGIGYQFTEAKNKEDEIAQGANHYLASFAQTAQMMQVGVAISKLNETLPQHALKLPVSLICNLGPLLALPGLLYCAAVKQGQQEMVAKSFNETRFAYLKLPETLNGRTVSVLSFISEHCGDMLRVAMVVTSVALIALGEAYYGVAILSAIAIEVIDNLGLIPRRISLFMEIYLPTVALVSGIVGGTVLVRIINAIQLTNYVPMISTFIHHKVDQFVRYYFTIGGPTLVQIDAPLVEKKQMTLDEINQILESDEWAFEINPSHCSHPIVDIDHLPKDNDFDEFLTLFNAIDWEGNYHAFVRHKLKDDDRFIEFLLEKFPGKTEDDLKNDFETFMEELAEKEELTKEAFAAKWMREQMVILVEVLQGERRVKGQQQDLDEAIHDAEILLPYVRSLDNAIEQEDVLATLAVEGGDYCGRALKRVANDKIRLISLGEQGTAIDDPIRSFEVQILQFLQNCRHATVLQAYKEMMNQMKVPDAISNDTHGFDVYRLLFSLGFYPLSKYERNHIGLSELGIWEFYNFQGIINAFYAVYQKQLMEPVSQIGYIHLADYIRRIIQDNDQLTDDEKDELIEKFTERNDGQWSVDETHERFTRLLYVRLGVLIPTS